MGPESDQLLSRVWFLGLQDKTQKVSALSFPHPCILQSNPSTLFIQNKWRSPTPAFWVAIMYGSCSYSHSLNVCTTVPTENRTGARTAFPLSNMLGHSYGVLGTLYSSSTLCLYYWKLSHVDFSYHSLTSTLTLKDFRFIKKLKRYKVPKSLHSPCR